MKKYVICLSLLWWGLASGADGQLVCSFKTNTPFGLQAADIGYRVGNFEPYASLSLFHFKANTEDNSTDWSRDPNSGQFRKDHTYTYAGEGRAFSCLPTLGVRYRFQHGKLKPFIFADAFKVFTTIDGEFTNTNTSYDSSGNVLSQTTDTYDDPRYLEQLKGLLSPWGLGCGGGVEYMVTDNLGIFGDYTFRMYFMEGTTQGTDTDEYADWRYAWEDKFSAALSLTSASLGVRFYF